MPDSSPFLKALKKEYKPLPSASIGQYTPSAPAPFSPQSAAASNPMLAPQFDTSYSPSSSGTSYEKKTPYDAGSAFNTGGSSFDSFGSAPTRRRYSNPISQTTYSEPLSFSDAGSSFQQPTSSVPYDSGSAFNTTTTTYQDPFQVSPLPFQFRSETSSPAIRPTEVTEITTAAPSRDAYTGAAAQMPSTEQPNVAFDELGRGSINGVPLYTGDRVESLGENVAAIEAVARPDVLVEEPAVQAPLTADSLGPVFFPGLQQQSMDSRLELANQDQAKIDQMANILTDGMVQKAREGSTVGGFVEDTTKKGFDYLFGAPTAEQAQNTLDTLPTDPAQRARLQATAAGEGTPSDLSQVATYLFGRPENAGDPNILGPQAPAAVEIGNSAPVAQDPTVNLPTETLTPDSSSLFDTQSTAGFDPKSLFDTQSTAGFDPKSLFDIGSTQGVTPQVAEKYQGEFADRELVGNLSGIIEKDGIEYGVVEGVPDENETIIKGGRGEFIEVSPERKAALERLGKLARTSEAVEARVKKNQSKWTQKQRDNFAETGNKNVSMSQKIAKDREFAANAPMREYNRFVEEQESKTRTTNRQLEKDKNREMGDVLFDYPYSQRKAAERAIEEKYINIKRYNDQQNANAKREALSLANSGMQAARAAANLQAQQDSAAASLRQRQIEAQDLQDYRSRPAPPSTMREKLNVINSLPISQEEKNKRIYGLVGGEDYEYPGDEISNSAVTQQAKNIKEKLKEGEVAMMGPDNKPAAVPREEVEDAKLNGYVEL